MKIERDLINRRRLDAYTKRAAPYRVDDSAEFAARFMRGLAVQRMLYTPKTTGAIVALKQRRKA